MHPSFSFRRVATLEIVLTLIIPLTTALAPLLLHGTRALGRHHIYASDPADPTTALVPLAGVLSVIAALAVLRVQSTRTALLVVPYALLAVGNVLVWTRLVTFDPCYGDLSGCADIGGGPMKALSFFVVTTGIPVLALVCGLSCIAASTQPTR
ncbi:MAG: hypothetical protein JWP74_214 [Marmoricola sp.]|nr:hypothetical protein [Marmoricola sp.]